jgi:hypothetical protein
MTGKTFLQGDYFIGYKIAGTGLLLGLQWPTECWSPHVKRQMEIIPLRKLNSVKKGCLISKVVFAALIEKFSHASI